MPGKLRPGVVVAQKLAVDENVDHWRQVEALFLASNSRRCPPLQKRRDELSRKLRQDDSSSNTQIALTKQELLEIVLAWKFSVGKPRPAVRRLVQANSNEQVADCTRAGFAAAMNLDMPNNDKDMGNSSRTSTHNDNSKVLQKSIQIALQEICQLRGMGPAGASAVLSLVRPDIIGYMYDEVIETYCPKRVYTMPVYLQMNEQCRHKARQLNVACAGQNDNEVEKAEDVWTAHRVATTLWMAARLAANGETVSFLKETDGAIKAGKKRAGSANEPTKRRKK